jgi:predicted HTH domain antitoxin
MLLALKLTPDALLYEIKLSAAIKLYELGRLSSGAAAEFAGIPKPVFLHKLADYGVTARRIHDARHAAIALTSGVTQVYTYDTED